MKKRNKYQKGVYYRINRQITSPTVRLLEADGKQIGVVSIDEAIRLAEEKTQDLVEIAPSAKPPVVKIIDYNKFLYQLKKKKQEEKKHMHKSETKQIQCGPFIDSHDLGIKLGRAREFIAEGDKVRFVIRFKGREMARVYIGRELMQKIIDQMSDVAKVEREMKMEGRQLVMVMSKGAVAKPEEEKVEAPTVSKTKALVDKVEAQQTENKEDKAPEDSEVQVN